MQTMNLRSGSDATVMKLCNHDMDMDMHYTVMVYNTLICTIKIWLYPPYSSPKTWPTNVPTRLGGSFSGVEAENLLGLMECLSGKPGSCMSGSDKQQM